jgi:hypothetical protein
MVLLLFLPREGERDNTHSFFASKRIDGGQKMWEVNFKLQPTIDYIHKQLHLQCDDTNHNQTPHDNLHAKSQVYPSGATDTLHRAYVLSTEYRAAESCAVNRAYLTR